MNVHAVRVNVAVMANTPGLTILRLIVDASVRTTRLISTQIGTNARAVVRGVSVTALTNVIMFARR